MLRGHAYPVHPPVRIGGSRVLGTGAILLLIGVGSLGPEPLVRSAVSGSEFVRAVAERRASLVDFYLSEHFDPNAQVAQDRSLLLAAALEQDWATARMLLYAGAWFYLAY